MIRLALLGSVVVAVLLTVGAVAVVKLFGWWSVPILVAGLAGLAWAGKVLAGKAFMAAIKMPFKAKGAVLRGATATVNSVLPGEPPPRSPDDEDDDEEGVPHGERRYYWLDVAVTPLAPTGKFTMWEPGDLVLVAPTAKPDDVDDEESYGVSTVEVWEEDRFVPDEGYKYEGERRLRLLVGVPPAWRAARFRYYFELFGDVRFP